MPESDGAGSRSDQRSYLHLVHRSPAVRAPLPGDRDADVCIVGAGYTGLWTAYYLKRADPSLRIVVMEARFAGFGASGRNGGWLSGLVPGDRHRMAKRYGRDRVLAWQQALNDAVDEVIDVAGRERIDAGIVKGGTLHVARNPAQASRLAAEVDEERLEGRGHRRTDQRRISTTHSARRRTVGLSQSALRADTAGLAGAGTGRRRRTPRRRHLRGPPATEIRAGRVGTTLGAVSAPVVLRATEGFTA